MLVAADSRYGHLPDVITDDAFAAASTAAEFSSYHEYLEWMEIEPMTDEELVNKQSLSLKKLAITESMDCIESYSDRNNSLDVCKKSGPSCSKTGVRQRVESRSVGNRSMKHGNKRHNSIRDGATYLHTFVETERDLFHPLL